LPLYGILPSIFKSLRLAMLRSDLGSLSFQFGFATIITSGEARVCCCLFWSLFTSGGFQFFSGFRLVLFILPPSVGRGGCNGDSEGGVGKEYNVLFRLMTALSYGLMEAAEDPSGL